MKERLNDFPVISRTKQGCLLSSHLFNTVPKILATVIRYENETILYTLERKE